jgi:hypothetical protein
MAGNIPRTPRELAEYIIHLQRDGTYFTRSEHFNSINNFPLPGGIIGTSWTSFAAGHQAIGIIGAGITLRSTEEINTPVGLAYVAEVRCHATDRHPAMMLWVLREYIAVHRHWRTTVVAGWVIN